MKLPNIYRMKMPRMKVPEVYQQLSAWYGEAGAMAGPQGEPWGTEAPYDMMPHLDTPYGRLKMPQK